MMTYEAAFAKLMYVFKPSEMEGFLTRFRHTAASQEVLPDQGRVMKYFCDEALWQKASKALQPKSSTKLRGPGADKQVAAVTSERGAARREGIEGGEKHEIWGCFHCGSKEHWVNGCSVNGCSVKAETLAACPLCNKDKYHTKLGHEAYDKFKEMRAQKAARGRVNAVEQEEEEARKLDGEPMGT